MRGYSNLMNMTTDLGSGFDRVRVDQGRTGLYEGREFRVYFEFCSEKTTALAVGGTRSFKFVSPVDFILQSQSLKVDTGGVRLLAYIDAVDGVGWTPVPVVANNRSPNRREFPTGYYARQANFFTGGTFTGGTEVDVLRARSASQSVSSENVDANQEGERYLPAGTYHILMAPLNGVNDSSQGVYSLSWEERP